MRIGRSATSRSWAVLLACVLLALSLVACGGSGSTAASLGHNSIRADGDGDNPADFDDDSERAPPAPDGKDADGDTDNDRPAADSYSFPDDDDKLVLDYGRPASGAEAGLLTGIVKHYFALAAAGEAARACSLLPRGMAEEFAQLYKPAYLPSGEETCQAIVSRVFAHFHSELVEPVRVVAVRVKGTTAQVVIGSSVMRARNVMLMRRHGVWRIQEEPLGQPLV